MNRFSETLAELEQNSLLRKCRTSTPLPQGRIEREGCICMNFASNDYLGLALHPAIILAAKEATEKYGAGSGSARLLGGTTPAHEELEMTLAQFKGTEAALGFSSGFAMSLGVIPALVETTDVILLDKLCHASLIDGAKLSGAILRIFPHNDVEKLESHLRWAREKHPQARILILTESIFSMDGDTAPLREIVELKTRYGAQLLLDEAHAVGVLGRGLAEHEGVSGQIDFHMGTLGKALGSAGGYLASSRVAIDFLVNKARSFIFSTAPGAAACAAATAALRLIETAEGEAIQVKLWRNIHTFVAAIDTHREYAPPKPLLASSAIIPLHVGSEANALRIANELLADGVLAPAVRYPTVQRGKARLRVNLSAAHDEQELQVAAEKISRALNRTLRPDRE